MMGYSATDVFTKKEQVLLSMAKVLVECLPEIPGLRCHEVARAVGTVLGLETQDGHYGPVEHSWLVVPPRSMGRGPGVLDVYSVGSLPTVRLCDGFLLLPYAKEFQPGIPRQDIDEGLVMDLIDCMHARLLGAPL